MQASMVKYKNPPIVEATSTAKLADVLKKALPLGFYLCQPGRFYINLEKERAFSR